MEEKGITRLSFDVNSAIRPEVIERIWQNIKRELTSDGYPVESIEMPRIAGWTLDTNNLRKAWEITSSSPALVNTSLEEYGEELKEWSACTIPSNVDQMWRILIWKEMRPIRKRLRHELLHVWESLLGLKWGALREYQSTKD